MFRKLLAWYRSRSAFCKITTTAHLVRRAKVEADRSRRKLDGQTKKIADVADRCRRKLDGQTKKIADVQRWLMSVCEETTEDLEDARNTQRQLEEAVEALRSELKIVKEIELKGMVAAHTLFVERIDAATAEAVRRKVGVMPGEIER